MQLHDLVGWGGIPVVIAFCEFAKRVKPDLDKRWLPLAALAFAEFWTVATALTYKQDVAQAALLGIVVAFAAIGTYSGVRATTGK